MQLPKIVRSFLDMKSKKCWDHVSFSRFWSIAPFGSDEWHVFYRFIDIRKPAEQVEIFPILLFRDKKNMLL